MKDIKFRAWNHDTKRMSELFTLMDNIEWYVDEQPCYDLMQFSGLLDTNEKEIFEEDILRIDLGIKMDSQIKESNYFYVKVYFENGCWMVYGISGWKPFGYSDWTLFGTLSNGANEKIEVIGNIYENPEYLLKLEL